MERKLRASRIFNKFLKLTLGTYLKLKFRYRMDIKALSGLKPPYIILANHTNFWDPFLLSMCIPEPVYFVTSDAYFRNPVLRLLLKLVGAIPKTKLVSDPSSIKYIISVVKNKGIVGIFPEGRRNWDGTTLPLLHPTAKLIKSLELPVVSVLLKGACLSMPRWAEKTRKGRLTMSLARVLDTEDYARLSADEIYGLITQSLEYSEYAFQRTAMIPFRGRRLAEKLELFLFCCPECKSIGGMESSDDEFYCKSCGYRAKYNAFGFFEQLPYQGSGSSSQPLYFDNPGSWNLWQLDYLQALIHGAQQAHCPDPVIQEADVLACIGSKLEPLRKLGVGRLALYDGSVDFISPGRETLSFSVERMYGVNIQYNNQLEFYYDKALYRFGGARARISAYKWAKAIEIYNQLKKSPEVHIKR